MEAQINEKIQPDLVFKFKTKTKTIITLLTIFALVPIVLSLPSLYFTFPYYFLGLGLPLVVFLTTFSKKYVVNDEGIQLKSLYKVIDKSFRWERITEASVIYFKFLPQGSDFQRICQPFSIMQFFASRGPKYILKIFVDGAEPMAILPNEVERFEELCDFINAKFGIQRR